MKRIVLLAVSGWLCAVAAAATPTSRVVVLASDIVPSAAPGRPVQFRDSVCRYVGQLVRESGGAGINTSMIDLAGGDSGVWHVHITTQACHENSGEVVRDVALRVDLPHPPSLAGGGGVPPLPRGYQAGARFELRAR